MLKSCKDCWWCPWGSATVLKFSWLSFFFWSSYATERNSYFVDVKIGRSSRSKNWFRSSPCGAVSRRPTLSFWEAVLLIVYSANSYWDSASEGSFCSILIKLWERILLIPSFYFFLWSFFSVCWRRERWSRSIESEICASVILILWVSIFGSSGRECSKFWHLEGEGPNISKNNPSAICVMFSTP